MASARKYAPDRFVEYRGHLYRALSDDRAPMITLRADDGEPVPEGLDPDPRGRPGFYIVAPADVTAWYSSSWTFRWKGELFSSGGLLDGRIYGYYQGSKGAAFADEYLTRTGAIEYEGDFPLQEVTDLTEKRYDLLSAWKAKHSQ